MTLVIAADDFEDPVFSTYFNYKNFQGFVLHIEIHIQSKY